jgi:hypothetical protein
MALEEMNTAAEDIRLEQGVIIVSSPDADLAEAMKKSPEIAMQLYSGVTTIRIENPAIGDIEIDIEPLQRDGKNSGNYRVVGMRPGKKGLFTDSCG